MARIKKYADNLTQNLTYFQTFVTDTNPNSTYFRITEFKEAFTGGKNGFLIEGSEHLKESTDIKIEILDVDGNPIYFEPGDGVPEYYEGLSKVIAVYIYEDTPIGNAKITILGELKTYIDGDDIVQPIPAEWAGIYNVKWERDVKVNRLLANEDKVRFYVRPQVTITEIVKPIFSNVVAPKIQKGYLTGTPLIPTAGTSLKDVTTPTSYLLTTTDNTFWTASVVGTILNFDGGGYYQPFVESIVNSRQLIVGNPYVDDITGLVANLGPIGYTASFNYTEGVDNLKTALTGSFAKIAISDLTTFVGDCARVKIFRKSTADLSDFQFVQEIQLESNEMLVDLASTTKNQENYGLFDNTNFKEYWVSSSNNLVTSFDQSFLFDSIKLNSTSGVQKFFTTKSFNVNEGIEYTLDFNVRKEAVGLTTDYIEAYLSGSRQTTVNGSPSTIQIKQSITTLQTQNALLQKQNITENIKAEQIDNVRLYFDIKGSDWHIADVSLKASQETAFSPDEITFIQSVPRTLPIETFVYRFEFYDINNNYIPVLVEETKTFDGGNLQTIRKQLKLVPSLSGFQFDSGSMPVPPTTIFIQEQKTLLTGSVHYTSQSFDFFGNALSGSDYTASWTGRQYPGLLNGIGSDTVYMTVGNFTGSRDDINVQLVRLTGEVEGYTDTINIYKILDGFGGVNHLIRPYRGTQIRNSSTSSLEIQAVRIDGINDIKISSTTKPEKGWPDFKLHVISASLNPLTEPEKFITLEVASSSKFIKGLTSGSLGSGEINYNATFNRDSIDFRRTIYLISSLRAASGYAYNVSSSVVASIQLEDLQDGLGSGIVTYNADSFTINPRTEGTFRPEFAFATASFAKRSVAGESEFLTASFKVWPSMSINKDWIPEYWMYYTTQSCHTASIEITAIDENKNPIYSKDKDGLGLSTNQSKNLTLTFTYTEPWTSASVSVDKTFTIVPEGKQGDESIIFEVNPMSVTLGANSRGIVNDYKPSITDIRLKQGSRYLAFSSSAHTLGELNTHGTFYIATASIIDTNITAGNVHFTSSYGTQYTASLIVSASSNMNELSGSITYPLIIHPYYTSSIYTASVVVNYTKVLEGAPPIQILLTPTVATLTADEVGYITPAGYTPANTTIQVKEGEDFLKLITTESFANADARKGTYKINSIETRGGSIWNIRTGSLASSSLSGLTGTMNYNRFDYPYVSASALYTIQVYPYALGAGHLPTSSIYTRTQTFTKNVTPPKARSVDFKASSYTVNYDRNGRVSAASQEPIYLSATAFNTTASAENVVLYLYDIAPDGSESGETPFTGDVGSNPVTFTLPTVFYNDIAPDSIKTYKVKLVDGNPYTSPTINPYRAEAQLTISGVKAGADSYKLASTNDNCAISADLWGVTSFAGTGQKITTFAGTQQLTNWGTGILPAPSDPSDLDYNNEPIGLLGYSSASIFSKSAWITMADTKFPNTTVAEIGNITGWTNPAINTSGQIVYKIDFEGGYLVTANPYGTPPPRQTQYVTQSISVQFTPPAPYAAQLENEVAAAVYKVSGQFTLDGTFTKIRAVRGDTKLTSVTSFTGGQNDVYGVLGYKEKSLVKITGISNHITLGGGLGLNSVLPVDAEGRAYTSGIQTWDNPETNQTATIVFEIDCEGRQKLYKTQSLSVQFEGNTGPGVVMRGNWLNSLDYIGSVETTNYRRDAVIYPPNGNPTTYYAAVSGSGPATYDKNNSYIVGAQAPSGTTADNAYWQYLGTQDFFVAAKIAIFDESYVKNTINVGTKDGNSAFANIVLAGGRNDPYMAMGQAGTSGASGDQTSTGVIGYDRPGIFLGIYENGAAGTTGRFSIKSSDGNRALKWDGDTLTIVGSINQVAPGQNAGTLRGAWASSTVYYANDVVTYGGQSWQCTSTTSHTSTNNTNASTGYPGAGPWTIAAAAGAAGANGTSGVNGANGTSGLNGNNGADGSPGPGVVFRGNYDSGTAYFHTADGTRRDVVRYPAVTGTYYLANNVSKSGLATWGTPGVSDWSTFGATFSSVATDILLAQDATITRGLVIGTDGTYTGYLRSVNATSLTAGKGYFLNNLGQFRLGDATSTVGGKYLYWDDTDLVISGIIRLKDTNNVTKVLLDYGTTSTADPANSTSGILTISGYAAGTATFQNGVLSGQGANGYLQVPYGTATGDPTSGTTYVAGDWPFAPTWNMTRYITAPLTAAYELTFKFPVSSLRKTTWISGTKHSGPYVDMRLYVKDSDGYSVYTGFNGEDYVNSPVFDADFGGNFYEQINPGSPPTDIVLYMSGVNMIAGEVYSVLIQYIVYNIEYDNYFTVDYYMPTIDITYNASVSSTVLNQVGINVGQDTDRYFLTRPDFLSSLDTTSFPTDATHTNVSFQDRRTIGHIGGTFLLLNQNHIEWHNAMQRIYINNASYPRSNRSAGGNFMTSYIFGGYNRAFQILRAYAMFEPDSTTNCSGTYSELWWPYCMNIEKITYVTTNTWQVFFVEALQDSSTYLNATVDRGFYGVVVAANGTATGPVPQIVRVFDTYPTSFKIELSNEDSSGSRINILVYK